MLNNYVIYLELIQGCMAITSQKLEKKFKIQTIWMSRLDEKTMGLMANKRDFAVQIA